MGATQIPLLPVKECGTPDTVWGADASARFIKFTAHFPVPLIKDAERSEFIAEMHAAMLPVVERLYERRWAQMFAGTADAEGRPYPARYSDLWPAPSPADHSALIPSNASACTPATDENPIPPAEAGE